MSIPQKSTEELSELMEKIEATPELEAAFWALVSQKHYAMVLAQAGKSHEIGMLNERFDWAEVEKQGQAYRRYAGKRGVAETHTVRQLCRGLVLRHYYHWSYRTTAQKVREESLYRWFVGYDLHERTFSAVTLERFEVWLKEHHPHLLFVVSLKQIDEDFPEEKRAPQIGDTFAMRSRAHEQSRTQLLRTLALRILTQLEINAPELRQSVAGMLSREELFGASSEQPEWRQAKEARDKLEERTARAAHHLLRGVRQELASLPHKQDVVMQALERWLGYLDKVLNDEFILTLNEEGVCTQATLRTKHEKGAYVIGSAIDPEATFRRHGERCDLGYNISVHATKRFIRAVDGKTGATPDSQLVAPALAEQLKQLGTVPPKLIYDRAAGSPKIFAEVDKASAGKTQLVARLIDHAKGNAYFGPQDCTLDAEGFLTCPAGRKSSRAYRAGSGDGWHYRFLASDCADCPLLARCRRNQEKPKGNRNFFISDYAYHQRQALAYLKTEAFTQDMRLRPAIERIIACLVRYHGARRATSYGVDNAVYQARMSAMAFNLKTWVTLTRERRKPKRAGPRDDSG
ncbi:MAG: hypothetical protein KatS3mg050_2183 [Litorilinea sp.]|nr:MAG: hypothetical protein KatS3mg050_1260 [Litorilinea sp.]GIV76867.1 MAG: hypothetical protein KatS3mg050_1261 [Litorilinea sp.]GIV77789.1 MAG: hypothetical protein KatS3mg050_2183 [Litorilinea sp.]